MGRSTPSAKAWREISAVSRRAPANACDTLAGSRSLEQLYRVAIQVFCEDLPDDIRD